MQPCITHLAFAVPAAGASAVVATDDEEALSKSCKEVAKAGTDFVWTQLRSLGTFLGGRAAQKQQQQRAKTLSQQQASQEQQAQPVVQPSSGAAANPNQSVAAVSDGANTAGPQGDPNPSQNTQAMLDAFQPDVAGAVAGDQSGRQPKDHTGANCISNQNANICDASNQNGTVTKEEGASTTHEHTESHKYVTTERDASGSQQATAEVVQKQTTTHIHKRKREETSANGENGHIREKEETSLGGRDGIEADPSQSQAGPVEGPVQQCGPTAQSLTADCQGAGMQNCRHNSHELVCWSCCYVGDHVELL